jgi:hypothetical protein
MKERMNKIRSIPFEAEEDSILAVIVVEVAPHIFPIPESLQDGISGSPDAASN